MCLAELIKQSGNEEVDDDENVRVSTVKSKKITTTTGSAIPAGRKLLMTSRKVILLKDE